MITDATETRWQHVLHPELCSVDAEQPFSFVEKAYMLLRDVAFQQWVMPSSTFKKALTS